MKGFIPRRLGIICIILGGGFGGSKKSGQMRFGCRYAPFTQKSYLFKIRSDVDGVNGDDECWRKPLSNKKI